VWSADRNRPASQKRQTVEWYPDAGAGGFHFVSFPRHHPQSCFSVTQTPGGFGTSSILDPADVVATLEVRLRGRRLSSAPDEDDVAEDDRNGAGLLIDDWTILDVKVQMWP
jgi:hypothetical protein